MSDSPIKLQETVELTTPVTQAKVVVRGYVTGRIKQAISAIYLAGASYETDKDGNVKAKNIASGLSGQQATNKAIAMIVLSVNGDTTDVLDKVLDLPEDDYDFVVAEVNKVQAPLAQKTATDSPTNTPTPSTQE